MESLAVVFTGKDQVEAQRQSVPEPGPGQVLVKGACSLISTGTECIVLQRNFAPGTHWDRWVKYPFHPGYSFVGRVAKLGEGVTEFKEDDRIFARTKHCQHVLLDEARALLIPPGVSDEEATFAALGKIVQHGFRKARLELGETVVVVGLGLLGQLVTQYCRLAGAAEIIAIDPVPGRLKLAEKSGATRTLAMGADQAADAVRELTSGRMADVVFEMTGHPTVFSAALALPRRLGRLVLIGDAGAPNQQTLSPDVVTRDLTIIGAHDSNSPSQATDHAPWSSARMTRLIFHLIEHDRMRVEDLVSHRFNIEQAPQAYELLTTRRDEAMGVILNLA